MSRERPFEACREPSELKQRSFLKLLRQLAVLVPTEEIGALAKWWRVFLYCKPDAYLGCRPKGGIPIKFDNKVHGVVSVLDSAGVRVMRGEDYRHRQAIGAREVFPLS